MSASASVPPMWNRMRKTSAFLRKLSLKAEKNWVQNRGAKRRVMSRDEDMASPFVGPWSGPMPTGTSGLKDANLGQRTIQPRGERSLARQDDASTVGTRTRKSTADGTIAVRC